MFCHCKTSPVLNLRGEIHLGVRGSSCAGDNGGDCIILPDFDIPPPPPVIVGESVISLKYGNK